MVQLAQAVELLPQVDQGLLPAVQRQVLPHALGHHAESSVLARKHGAVGALGDVLIVQAHGEGGGLIGN